MECVRFIAAFHGRGATLPLRDPDALVGLCYNAGANRYCPAMYERFTDRARKVMALARDEAQRRGSLSMTTTHVLLGLLTEGSGVAAHALQRLNVDFETLKSALIADMTVAALSLPTIEPGSGRQQSGWRRAISILPTWMTSRSFPQATETKRLVEHALLEARALQHNYVGTEHLLLGLLAEPECAATKLLFAQGLKGRDIRQEVLGPLRTP